MPLKTGRVRYLKGKKAGEEEQVTWPEARFRIWAKRRRIEIMDAPKAAKKKSKKKAADGPELNKRVASPKVKK